MEGISKLATKYGGNLPADLESLRHALGLDQSLHVQLWRYVRGLLHFDFGTSLQSRRPVVDLLLERLPATLELTLAALCLAPRTAYRRLTPALGGSGPVFRCLPGSG